MQIKLKFIFLIFERQNIHIICTFVREKYKFINNMCTMIFNNKFVIIFNEKKGKFGYQNFIKYDKFLLAFSSLFCISITFLSL